MSETALLYEILQLLRRVDVRVNERLARIELSLERIAPPNWRQIEQQPEFTVHQYGLNAQSGGRGDKESKAD